jgi:1-acyl-sn-glycerol-3-phosphate acyltransferase
LSSGNLAGVKVGSKVVYRIAVSFFDLTFLFTGGITSRNSENVPRHGGVIICPIHLSSLDPPALACTMRHRRLLAMAKEELWKNRIFGWIIRQIGAFPIRRGEGDREAIRYAQLLLEAGNPLLMFPEGTRGSGRNLQAFASGPMIMAKKTGLPVVPVGISGTQRLLPKDGVKAARQRIVVNYGHPFTWAELATSDSEKENRARFMTHLRQSIHDLCVEAGLELEPLSNEVPA